MPGDTRAAAAVRRTVGVAIIAITIMPRARSVGAITGSIIGGAGIATGMWERGSLAGSVRIGSTAGTAIYVIGITLMARPAGSARR